MGYFSRSEDMQEIAAPSRFRSKHKLLNFNLNATFTFGMYGWVSSSRRGRHLFQIGQPAEANSTQLDTALSFASFSFVSAVWMKEDEPKQE